MPTTLLPRDAPRSSRHDHDLEAAAAPNLKMYRVTGAFADPSHELAFSLQLFSLAYACHIFLLALTLACNLGLAVIEEGSFYRLEMRAFRGTLALGVLLVGRMVWARVNPVRGQRMSAWSWTTLLVLSRLVNFSGYITSRAAVCGRSWEDKRSWLIVYPMVRFWPGTLAHSATHTISVYPVPAATRCRWISLSR